MGDATAQPTLPTRRSNGDGHGDGTPRAGAGPVIEEHPHCPRCTRSGGGTHCPQACPQVVFSSAESSLLMKDRVTQ